ncbi:MAG TPA: outer membrane beta-barrel protein, partial [Acidobacteriota bacterium]|nr:outer membrane beta-barrel protein [Acidobacteriota bacterium]
MEERIEQAISQAPLRAGAFWVIPKLDLFGAYDSNSLLLATEVRDDVTFQATPGLRAILPFHKRALLEVFDDVNFIYYRDLEDLRGVFNTVGGRFTIGGNRILFTVGDIFAVRRAGPTQEFDFPTNQQNNNFDSSLTVAVAERSEIRAFVSSYSSNITEDIVNPTAIPLSQFFDQTTFRVGGGFRRGVSSFTYFTADSFYEKWDFPEQSQQPDADVFVAQGGFSFQAKGNIVGEATLGYKRMKPNNPEDAEYSGLIGRGAINFRAGERTLLGFEYTREVFPSVTDSNWFFIE